MGRSPCCDQNGLKKGPWTPEEDQKLVSYIQKHGYRNWRTLPKNAGLQRCGKSCRLRWTNYLRPDIKRGRFSFEEEESIIQLHSILGNKWSAIAARLPGRTDNEIKNYWNTHIRKMLLRMGIDPVTHSPRLNLLDILSSSLYNPSQINMSRILGTQPLFNPELLRLATSLVSSSSSSHQHQNQLSFVHNGQENQVCNRQVENQFEPLAQPNQFDQNPILEIPDYTTFTGDQAQLMEPSNEVHQFPSTTFTNFTSHNSQLNEWQQSNGMPSSLLNEDYGTPLLNYGYNDELDQTIALHSNSNGNQNFSYTSVFSTPSSSPTPMNSNSAHINGSGTEDERDSYCSNMLKFEIPDIFDVNEFM